MIIGSEKTLGTILIQRYKSMIKCSIEFLNAVGQLGGVKMDSSGGSSDLGHKYQNLIDKYFRIARGKNLCGIADYITYPIVKASKRKHS